MSERWVDAEPEGARHEVGEGVVDPGAARIAPRDRSRARAIGEAVALGFELGCLLERHDASPHSPEARASLSDDVLVTGRIDEPAAHFRAITNAIRALPLGELNERLERSLSSLEAVLQSPDAADGNARRAAFALHVQMVEALSALRLAKAYGIGRGLSALSGTVLADDVAAVFREPGFKRIDEWLVDLELELSPGVVQAVRSGLSSWKQWAQSAGPDEVAVDVDRQMQLYRSLLGGELTLRRLLSFDDYESVAVRFARRLHCLVSRLVLQSGALALLIVAVVGGGAFALQAARALDESERVLIDVVAGAAGLALLLLHVSTILKRTLGRVESALWNAALVQSAVRRATKLPARPMPGPSLDGDEEWAFLGFFSSPTPPTFSAPAGGFADAKADFYENDSPTRLPPLAEPVSPGVTSPEETSLLERFSDAEAPPMRRRRPWLRAAAAIVVVVGIGAALRSFVLSSYYVPTGSMTPTLDAGDRILVDKLPFVRDQVHRGDVIVFSRPATDHVAGSDPLLVKRVIGLPGDRVSSVDDTIYINGRPLAEPWLPPLTTGCAEAAYNIPDEVVPANSYFVLGDCRANSDDSRTWGTVPQADVIGKVFLVYWRQDHPWFHWL